MTTIVEKIEELTESSVAQTEASQALALEVANKMGSIDLHVNNIEINLNNRINDEIANSVNPELQEAVDVLRDDLTRVETETHQHLVVTMLNRGIISGCSVAISPDTERTITISEGRCFMLGREWFIPAGAVNIPDNPDPSGTNWYINVLHTSDGEIIQIQESPEPFEGFNLAAIVIPGNNSAVSDPYGMNVGVTHTARREPNWPTMLLSPANQQIPVRIITSDRRSYHVSFDVRSYIGTDQPEIIAPESGRATNTFRVYILGCADVVTFSVSIHKMW